MRNITFGQVLVVIILIVLALANYILARMQRRFRSPISARQPVPDMGLRRQPAPEVTPASVASGERAQPAAPTATMPPARRRWSRETLFKTRRDVRRVMVAMTILGPCRAYDPPG